LRAQWPCAITPVSWHAARVTDSLSVACGQLISVGFEGTSVPASLRARIAAGEVGGVTVFGPNLEAPAQVAALVLALRKASPADAPLVVSIDQEGGRVQRLRSPLTVWPPMATVGAANDPERTETLGRFLGAELAALGIGWNLAPDLDVHTNPANPVIGDRAFGTTPDHVALHALAFWRGLRHAGLAGCGKHFPGHGDTSVDSHFDLPVVLHDEARLRAVEFAPFAAAAKAGIDALMTAHVMYPALDLDRPATLSHKIVTDVLRKDLGFEGLIVSDDMTMKAVADRYAPGELGVSAIVAGVNHLLMRRPESAQVEMHEGLVREAEKSAAFRERILESAARVAVFKKRITVGMPQPGALLPSLLGPPAHRALAGWFSATSNST
jgi:beta-N-acetylhexosaminidase